MPRGFGPEKRCPACGEVKARTAEFWHRHRSTPDGLAAYCKPCLTTKVRDYQDRNREAVRERARSRRRARAGSEELRRMDRDAHLRRIGFTAAEADEMLAAQGGICAVCGTDDPRGRHATFVVDHDHESGAVRGMLCNACNIGLGKFRDDPDVLVAAAAYLLQTRSVLSFEQVGS